MVTAALRYKSSRHHRSARIVTRETVRSTDTLTDTSAAGRGDNHFLDRTPGRGDHLTSTLDCLSGGYVSRPCVTRTITDGDPYQPGPPGWVPILVPRVLLSRAHWTLRRRPAAAPLSLPPRRRRAADLFMLVLVIDYELVADA